MNELDSFKSLEGRQNGHLFSGGRYHGRFILAVSHRRIHKSRYTHAGNYLSARGGDYRERRRQAEAVDPLGIVLGRNPRGLYCTFNSAVPRVGDG